MALKKLENAIGRKATLDFIKEELGEVNYQFCPSDKQLFDFRQKVNERIKNL